MENEGKLIDGYLSYLLESRFEGVRTYLRHRLFKDEAENPTLELSVSKLIESRIVQYNLATLHKNQRGHDITGLGRDVMKLGGYDQWRKIEDDNIKRQIKRENGIYIINKILAGTAIVSIAITAILSYYQFTTNNQIDNKLKDLAKQDSIFTEQIKTLMLPQKNQTKPKR